LLILHLEVLAKMIDTIGSRPAESGGAFGAIENSDEVSHYHFDKSSRTSAVTYSPDYKLLNKLFVEEWNPNDIRLTGFVHSHPGHMSRPSRGDEVYAERILRAIEDLDLLWLPIVNTVPETGQFVLTPWAAFETRDGVSVVRGKVKIIGLPANFAMQNDDRKVSERFEEPLHRNLFRQQSAEFFDRFAQGVALDHIALPFAQEVVESASSNRSDQEVTRVHVLSQSKTDKDDAITSDTSQTFDRVQEAYDLNLMRGARIIAVGAGGAASWLEEMARAGLGQFVLIDPDIVSETNLATQQTYRRDIGRPKVDCIAERIRDINPTAKTIAVQKSLDDLTDYQIAGLANDAIDGRTTKRTIICGLTDSFFAQARVNRIALHLGLPSLCAQVYHEGRGAEITFTYPGVTPACHRCILSSRYKHFLEQAQENDVTSHGTPIFSTTRLNAIKGFVTLALLHHGLDHPRWGTMLTRIDNRNLIQIRMDPDFADSLGMTVFDRVFEKADRERLFFDDVVWLPEEEESPETGYPHCPDCGGTGDLRDSIGKFENSTSLDSIREERVTKSKVRNSQHRRALAAYQTSRTR
jgi:hypothetical protein